MKVGNGKILRVLRKRTGISQAILGDKLGKSQSYISRVERGKKMITDSEVYRFLEVMRCSTKTYESLLQTNLFLEKIATYHTPNFDKQNHKVKEQKSKEELLKIVKDYFLHQPVKSAYVFGSVARGEHTQESDLDIMVAFNDSYKATLFDLIGFKQDLTQLTGYKVDIVQEGTAYPHVQKELEKENIAVYG
ncbi:MAG: nucleotidyltransferase domain-containing protein [Bacteroidota bacterium]